MFAVAISVVAVAVDILDFVVEETFDAVLERLVVDEADATSVLVQHCSSAAAQRQVLKIKSSNKFRSDYYKL